jgi:undecaprenyl-diphosphatase
MRTNDATWIGLVIIAILATLAAKYFVTFPGDVAVERWVQSWVPQNLNWAVGISRTAEIPWVLILLAFVFALSWTLGGWRAALLSVLSFAGMLALGKWLSPMIARPRPSPELVHVFQARSGYGFPSLFALRYAATFGFLAVLAVGKSFGMLRVTLFVVCTGLCIFGGIARVALGAHWPSDVILSYYLGLLWAAFLICFGPMALGPFKTQSP